MKKILIILICVSFCWSCDIDLSFSNDELAWIEPYKKGDTLIFRSNDGLEEKLIIKEVKVWNESRDSFSSNYNPIYAEVISEQGSLIKIIKSDPNETKAFFRFKNDFLMVKNLNELSLEKRVFNGKETSGYKFNLDSTDSKVLDFFWSINHGIIEYKDNTSRIWTLIM